MKKYFLLMNALVLLAISAGVAQQPAAPDSPSTRDDILRLFDTMQIRQQLRLVMESVAQQMQGITQEGMQAAYWRMQEQMDATMQRIERMVKEEQPKPKKTGPPPSKSKSPPKT